MLIELKQIIKTLKQKRKILDISQKELAKKAGVSQSLIAKIESNRINPSYDAMQKIENTIDIMLNNKEQKVIDVMKSPIKYVNVEDNLEKAKKMMKNNDFSQLPVKQDNEFVGSLFMNDLIDHDPSTKIKRIMEQPFNIVNWNTPITSIKPMIKNKHNTAILVRNEKGKITGIVTIDDLL